MKPIYSYILAGAGTVALAMSGLTFYTSMQMQQELEKLASQPAAQTTIVQRQVSQPAPASTDMSEVTGVIAQLEQQMKELTTQMAQPGQAQVVYNPAPVVYNTPDSYSNENDAPQVEKPSTGMEDIPEEYHAEVEDVFAAYAQQAMVETDALLDSGEYTDADMQRIKLDTMAQLEAEMSEVLPVEHFETLMR